MKKATTSATTVRPSAAPAAATRKKSVKAKPAPTTAPRAGRVKAAPTAATANTPSLARQLPRLRRKKSKLHGFGVFALEAINKNKRIVEYTGELISNKQSVNREDRYLRKGCIWVFRVNRNWSRDANVGGNIARFINHSCVHNCYVEVVGKTIWVRAARNIAAGEELTYDYNTEGDKTIPCRCRPNCKTRL
jgi:hypothetical protein